MRRSHTKLVGSVLTLIVLLLFSGLIALFASNVQVLNNFYCFRSLTLDLSKAHMEVSKFVMFKSLVVLFYILVALRVEPVDFPLKTKSLAR